MFQLQYTLVQPAVEPGQEVTEMMIPANKVGLVIGECEKHMTNTQVTCTCNT